MPRRLMAILRGLRPGQAASVGECLVNRGFEIIEVPLNSPDPFTSISILAREFGSEAVVGAGTVLTVEEVRRAAECGSQIIVSPNTDPAVISETKRLGLQSWPGAFTPTECFTALGAGADGIKLFPAGLAGPAGAAALRTVFPPGVLIHAVGGVSPEQFAEWLANGVDGFGIGSHLFADGMSIGDIDRRAEIIVETYDLAVKGRRN